MDLNQIYSIKDKIKRAQISINAKIKTDTIKTIVMILGITGEGKSSLAGCLTQKDIIVDIGKGKRPILKGNGIQSGLQSGTRVPQIIYDERSKILYCDCPGFEDTEGYHQEIINAFIIDYLFKINSNNRFKILLVVSSYSIEANRGNMVSKSFQHMMEMFPNPHDLEQGLGLVISKTDLNLDGQDYIDQLMDNSPSCIKHWCSFFKSNPNRVFTFPLAKKNQIGQKYDFHDHQKISHFLTTNTIKNPIHKIALSECAMYYIKNLQENVLDENKNEIISIKTKIIEEYRKECSSNKLKKWIDSINIEINNLNDVKKLIQKNCKLNNYSTNLQILDNNEIVQNFIHEILNSNKLSMENQKLIHSSFDFIRNEIKQLYKKALELEKQERIRIELKQKEEIKMKEIEKSGQEMIELRKEYKRIQKLNEETRKLRFGSINLDESSLIYNGEKVYFDISAFASTKDDFDKEIYLIDERYYRFHDYFPQGYIHCRCMLIEEKANDGMIIILIKKTYPHWTFYYYAYKFSQACKHEYYNISTRTVNVNGKEFSFQEKVIASSKDDLEKEIYLLNRRAENDLYPQGVHYCKYLLAYVLKNGGNIIILIRNTYPKTWFYFQKQQLDDSDLSSISNYNNCNIY